MTPTVGGESSSSNSTQRARIKLASVGFVLRANFSSGIVSSLDYRINIGKQYYIKGEVAGSAFTRDTRAKEWDMKPLGYLRSFAFAGVEPNRMGIGPAHAIPKALKKAGMKLSDMQALEINEAFAAQVLACERALASEKFAKDFNPKAILGIKIICYEFEK